MNKIVATPQADSAVEVGSSVDEKITVLNPVGYPPKINKKAAAPRPESLDGKTIYLVDCRFDDSVELLKAGAELVRRAHAGGEDQDDLALQHLPARRSQDLGGDQGERRRRHRGRRPLQQLLAGGRHPRDTLETRYGVPTVALHTDKFDRVVQSVTKMAGMPDAPRAFVPQPVMGKTAAELKAYVYGKDPITGRPVMQEIIAGLITALNG